MDLSKIKFLKGVKEFQPVTEGYGGAEKYLFEKAGKKYFIKAGKINCDENLETILSAAFVPHPKIVETGAVDEKNNYIIEEFVEGKPLKFMLGETEEKFVYEFGFRLGEKFRNLQKDFPNKAVDDRAFKKYSANVDRDIKSLKRQILKHASNFTANEIKFFAWMEEYLASNKKLIKNSLMVFGHNDIKPSNFLVNGNDICAIDIEGVKYKELSLSFLWSLSRADFKDEKNHAFVNGWLDALFNFNVPKCVLDCCNYTYLFNMCSILKKRIAKKDFAGVMKLMEHIKANYVAGGKMVLNKRLIKVAKISDFKLLRGFEFNLVHGSYTPTNFVFKCTKGKTKYFLKLMQVGDAKFEKILKGYQTLNSCGVPTPRVIDCGKCKSSAFHFVLFEFVDYPELQSTYTKFEDGVKFGQMAADYLKKFRNLSNNFSSLTKTDLFNEYSLIIDKIFDGANAYSIFKCSKTEMMDILNSLLKSLNNEKTNLIRYDLKTGNILSDGKNMIFVDNEDLVNSYEIVNFRYFVNSCFWGKHVQQAQGFVNGYLKSVHNGKLPQKIQNQMKLLLLFRVLDKFKDKKDCSSAEIQSNNYLINFKKYIIDGEEIAWLK